VKFVHFVHIIWHQVGGSNFDDICRKPFNRRVALLMTFLHARCSV